MELIWIHFIPFLFLYAQPRNSYEPKTINFDWPNFDIDKNSGRFAIPPLMLQTLVENGIKHGIANLMHGGEISITTVVKRKQLHLQIRNSGQLNEEVQSGGGVGLANTRKRLELIFGEGARFEMKNENEKTVLTSISIPSLDQAFGELG